MISDPATASASPAAEAASGKLDTFNAAQL
jgi:hypothetical protein